VLFDRDRARRRGPGRYQVKLRPNERALVADLVGQLREQLLASTDDPAVRRLFPPAYPDDAERDAGYQVLTRDTLLEQRLAALDTVEQSLDGRELLFNELAWGYFGEGMHITPEDDPSKVPEAEVDECLGIT